MSFRQNVNFNYELPEVNPIFKHVEREAWKGGYFIFCEENNRFESLTEEQVNRKLNENNNYKIVEYDFNRIYSKEQKVDFYEMIKLFPPCTC